MGRKRGFRVSVRCLPSKPVYTKSSAEMRREMSKNREHKYFGEFGGQYVSESLRNTLRGELEKSV